MQVCKIFAEADTSVLLSARGTGEKLKFLIFFGSKGTGFVPFGYDILRYGLVHGIG